MLYETAAGAAEVLALDVGDLDLHNRRARVLRRGGAVDVIVWQTGTARLLPRLLAGWNRENATGSGNGDERQSRAWFRFWAPDLRESAGGRRVTRDKLT